MVGRRSPSFPNHRPPLAAPLVAVLLLAAASSVWIGVPSNAGAQAATPATAAPATADNGLAALLRLAPAVSAGEDAPPAQIAIYADVAAQLGAVGVVPPATPEDETFNRFVAAIAHLPLPPDIAQHTVDPTWREAFGFDTFQVDRALTIGEPPRLTTILRGRFDERELQAAWRNTGYQPVAVDLPGAVVASLTAEPVVDLDSPTAHLALYSMNNAAILPDGTLVFSGTLDGVHAVLDVVAGRASPLANRPGVAPLLAAAGDLVSATLFDGSGLRGLDPVVAVLDPTPPSADELATRIAELGQMPSVGLALLGTTAGGPVRPLGGDAATPFPAPPGAPRARFVLALLLANRAAAETAVPVVLERLASGRSTRADEPWATIFPAAERRVAAIPDAPILLVDLGLGEDVSPRIGFDLLYTRDLGFVAW